MTSLFISKLLFLGAGALTHIVPCGATTDVIPDSVDCCEKTPQKGERILHFNEVSVSAQRRATSINAVSKTISSKDIQRALGRSLTATLEEVNGVSSIQTGSNTAKPVIQGMYGTRILMINNGVKQTGQQWGVDHAPEIDLHSSQSISVVKGAESVRYGAEALGGVILLQPPRLPYGVFTPKGHVNTLYGLNGHRYANVANVANGVSFLPQLAWRLQGTWSNAGDKRSAHYLLNNTGSRELNFSGALGWKQQNWKSELFVSRFDNKWGVLPNAQMGNIDLLKERIEIGRPTTTSPFSRHIGLPYQHVIHHNATLRLAYRDNQWGEFTAQTSFQQNHRTEHRLRRLGGNIPAVSFHLSTWQQTLHWQKKYHRWHSEIGSQWGKANHHNEKGTGIVPIIPNHTELTLGVYALQRYQRPQWGGEAGVRYDYQNTKAAGFDWTGKPYGEQHTFNNFTYTLGGHYRPLSGVTLTSNFGLAWRAPHVYELYSNGSELGSGIFMVGDSTLRSERGYKWITSLDYHNSRMKLRLDAFLQWIDNYIYDQPTHEYATVISGTYPLFRYRQTSAFLRGLELDAHTHLCPHWKYRLAAALIWANERSTGNYLPYIPAPRLTQEITWTPHLQRFSDLWFTLRHRYVAQQTRFNPESDLIPFAPPAYHLFGAELGVEYPLSARQKLTFQLSADNLLNTQYKEYTNRARYYSHDLGRDIRCTISLNF